MTEAQHATADPELEAAFEPAAKVAHRFYIVGYPNGVMRLAFAESSPTGSQSYHSAVVLSRDDATALRDVLSQQLEALAAGAAVAPPKAAGGIH